MAKSDVENLSFILAVSPCNHCKILGECNLSAALKLPVMLEYAEFYKYKQNVAKEAVESTVAGLMKNEYMNELQKLKTDTNCIFFNK